VPTSFYEWADIARIDADVLERGVRVMNREFWENYSPEIGADTIKRDVHSAAFRRLVEETERQSLEQTRQADALADEAEQEFAEYWGGEGPIWEAQEAEAHADEREAAADMEAGL
jgi:hypothetical protein